MASSSPAAQRRKGDDHRKGLPGTKATLPLSRRVWLYLGVLTLQYGAQPLLSKRFTGWRGCQCHHPGVSWKKVTVVWEYGGALFSLAEKKFGAYMSLDD